MRWTHAGQSQPGEIGEPIARPALALVLLVPVATIGSLAALWIAPGSIGKTVYIAGKVWMLLLPLAWMGFGRCHPGSSLRRGWRAQLFPSCSLRGISTGAGLGMAISLLVLGVYIVVRPYIDPGPLRAAAATSGFGTLAAYLPLGLYLVLVNSLLEEYVWRWFVFRACESLSGGAAAIAAAALMFTAHHVVVLLAYFPAWLAAIASGGVCIGGVCWSWCFLRFRSIWPGYLSHAIVDLAILWIGWDLLFR
jgi:uncharacterized protein